MTGTHATRRCHSRRPARAPRRGATPGRRATWTRRRMGRPPAGLAAWRRISRATSPRALPPAPPPLGPPRRALAPRQPRPLPHAPARRPPAPRTVRSMPPGRGATTVWAAARLLTAARTSLLWFRRATWMLPLTAWRRALPAARKQWL